MDQHVPAVRRERAHDRGADPLRPAGDDRRVHPAAHSGALCGAPARGYRPVMPMPPPPDDLSALSLADIARLAQERRLPPVEKWNPSHCGDSRMRIARDGTWYHEGAPIGGRRWSACSRRSCGASPTGASCCDAGREARHSGRGRALRRGRGAQRGRSQGRSLAFRLNTGIWWLPARTTPCASKRGTVPSPILRSGRSRRPGRAAGLLLAGEIALAEDARPPGLERGRLLPAGGTARGPGPMSLPRRCAPRSSSPSRHPD